MDFNLEEYIRAIVRECIAEGPEMKTRFTAEDIAQRFGWSPANARRVINNGSFGIANLSITVYQHGRRMSNGKEIYFNRRDQRSWRPYFT